MAVIYEHSNGLSTIALPPLKEVADTPAVAPVEPVLDDEGNVIQEGVAGTPATYRLETAEEQIQRMIAGNMMPNLPWSNWLLVPDDHPAMAGGIITVADWDDADTVTVTPHPKPKRRAGEFREFMELFTEQEQVAIATAAMQVPQIKLWYDKAMGGPSFSLDNPQTPYGLGALVQAGLLTQERMDEILDADFDELYT